MTEGFDINSAASHFPALGKKQVYFDNAGGSQVLGEVISSIQNYLSENNVQLGASYPIGQQSTARYSEGYAAAAKYINASTSEIVIGSSTTQLFRNLSFALDFKAGDELVISSVDHEANIAPWTDIADRLGLTVKWWTPKPSKNPKLLAEDLKQLMTEKTKLVTCTHASNILGTIHDIKVIAKAVHETPGAMICVDAVAYAPHRQIDVKDLDIDFYCFSWYKVYGPHVSMLYGREAAQKSVRSLGHYFNPSSTLENKLGLAGSSYELVQSIPRVARYLGSNTKAAWQAIAKHEEDLAEVLLQYLRSRSDITICGEPTANSRSRVPTIAFIVQDRKSHEVVEAVEKVSDFGFRWGKFYSNRLAENVLQTPEDGVVRVSMVHYNTLAEIQSFVETLDRAVPPAAADRK